MRKGSHALCGSVSAMALAGVALAANAQTTSAPSAGIETVVVTAQKRSENIQHVPIAMSAFTQKDLTTQQVAIGADLVKAVPNLTF